MFELICFAFVLVGLQALATIALLAWMFKKMTDKEMLKKIATPMVEVSLDMVAETLTEKEEEP